MIPIFPEFISVTLGLEEIFDKYTESFKPYAEFSFPCLFAWDTENTAEVSLLNNNLVIKMPDYTSLKPFYSILGNNNIDESIDLLLNNFSELNMVPEETVNFIINKNKYSITEDIDQNDYVYLLDNQVNLPGKHFKGRRVKSGRILKLYNESLVLQTINFNNEQDIADILQISDNWAMEKKLSDKDFEHERKAIQKVINHAKYFNLIGLMVKIEERGVGYSINQVLSKEYSVCRFQKSLISVNHLDVFLTKMTATELKHYGCKYISWEQDLGVPGLRQFKMSYKPTFFLKKYNIKTT